MKKSAQAYYDILKGIGIILRTHRKESNPSLKTVTSNVPTYSPLVMVIL